ncbi:hypothetical protein [Paraliobacillus salinarum]|uniref:hypothetical protein n=1 Tax=Paraliobacillus salinarum TaxID=1158996 RepID=UPI0015F4303A|nr:hypothetical protein [Paraliobacillus salinarum]
MYKEIEFFDWTVKLAADISPVVDIKAKKLALVESNFEFNGLIWIDEKNQLQIKPTWDCKISINPEEKILTFERVDS